LLSNPEVLLLDEPTVGLDPMASQEVRGYLVKAMAGRTVLFATHNLAEAEALCQSVIVIRAGRILIHEPLASIRKRFPRRALLAARQGPDSLARALSEEGFEARKDGVGVELTMADPEVVLPDLLRRLLGQGLDIYEARIIEPSLEEIFLAVVTDRVAVDAGP
jgi:ABC-type multidrug transport system ATPase subunit